MKVDESTNNGRHAIPLPETRADLLDNAPIALRVADFLENEIVTGRLAPGIRLSQADMADRLGISRGALREALNIVAGRGLLETIPRRGVFVRAFTTEQIEDIYAVRCALEQLAVATAIPSLQQEDLAESQALMRSMESAMEAHDVHRYHEANLQLHRLIFKWANNEVLTESYDRLSNPLYALRLSSLSSPRSLEESYTEHVAILDAMARGDADAASERMGAHVMRGARKVKRRMVEVASE